MRKRIKTTKVTKVGSTNRKSALLCKHITEQKLIVKTGVTQARSLSTKLIIL